MTPGQRVWDIGVVEIIPVGINAIVAGQAVVAIFLAVGLQEGCIHLGMAGAADGLVETGVALGMAVSTDIHRTI